MFPQISESDEKFGNGTTYHMISMLVLLDDPTNPLIATKVVLTSNSRLMHYICFCKIFRFYGNPLCDCQHIEPLCYHFGECLTSMGLDNSSFAWW